MHYLNTTQRPPVTELSGYLVFPCEYLNGVFCFRFLPRAFGFFGKINIPKHLVNYFKQFTDHSGINKFITTTGLYNGVYLGRPELSANYWIQPTECYGGPDDILCRELISGLRPVPKYSRKTVFRKRFSILNE